MRTMHPSGSKSATRCSRASANVDSSWLRRAPESSRYPPPLKGWMTVVTGLLDKGEPPSSKRSRRRGASENGCVKSPAPGGNQWAWFGHACYGSLRAGRSLMRRRAARARTAPPRATFGSRRERFCARAPSWRAPCGAGAVCVRRSVSPRAGSAARTARLP